MKTPKYEFIHTKSKDNREKTICLTHFAGKTVRGTCVCSDNDTYDREYGERLAQARCDARVASKRFAMRAKEYGDMLRLQELINANVEASYNKMLEADQETDLAFGRLEAVMAGEE